MKLELITIGNELLTGKTIDSNSAWLAEQFNILGVKTGRITSVSDSRDEIISILKEAGKRSDIVIMTGGLGPTSDDITKPVLCEFFQTKLVFRPEVFDNIKSLLGKKGHRINEHNRKQAEVPESATIVENMYGTAPGLWFEKEGTIFISLPGVPFEMKEIVRSGIIPGLKKLFEFPVIYYKTVLTQGSFEAMLAEKLENFEKEMPGDISLAYLPSPGIIKLRLGVTGKDKDGLERRIEEQIRKLWQIIPEYIIGYDDDTLENIVGKLLNVSGQSLSLAESCTGGTIASLITAVSGSSKYFKGGIVAYSNEIKTDQLAINPDVLNKYGAVSRQVVEDMATNTRLLFNTDYAVSVSGIAGPSGGTPEKPVGTTWIAVSGRKSTISNEFRFGDNRERNIRRASLTALNMLRKYLLAESAINN